MRQNIPENSGEVKLNIPNLVNMSKEEEVHEQKKEKKIYETERNTEMKRMSLGGHARGRLKTPGTLGATANRRCHDGSRTETDETLTLLLQKKSIVTLTCLFFVFLGFSFIFPTLF